MKKVNTISSWLDFLSPRPCLCCTEPSDQAINICSACESRLTLNLTACRCCAEPMQAVDALLCPYCQKKGRAFFRLVSPFVYRHHAARLVKSFKFEEDFAAGELLAVLFLKYLPEGAELPDLIVPIPLHPVRLRQRGFNQSAWMAQKIGRQLGVPVINALERSRPTQSQTELSASGRRRNMRNAFRARERLNARQIVIFDDVASTCATVESACRVLEAPKAQINVWTMARAPTAD